MPYTLLQTLGYLAATKRNYFSAKSARPQAVASKDSRCRLTALKMQTRKGRRRLLVFKTVGPGSKRKRAYSLPCGHGDCWVCGKLLGMSLPNLP